MVVRVPCPNHGQYTYDKCQSVLEGEGLPWVQLKNKCLSRIVCRKHLKHLNGKQHLLLPVFCPFSTMFSTLSKTKIITSVKSNTCISKSFELGSVKKCVI